MFKEIMLLNQLMMSSKIVVECSLLMKQRELKTGIINNNNKKSWGKDAPTASSKLKVKLNKFIHR